MDIEISIFMELLLKRAQRKAIDAGAHNKLQHIGHLHFRGAGREGTTLGKGDKELEKFVIFGELHQTIAKIFKSASEHTEGLGYLRSAAAWQREVGAWPYGIRRDEMADIFVRTVKLIERCVNDRMTFSEWRRDEEENDRDPLTSINWTKVQGNFKIRLKYKRNVAQQIEYFLQIWNQHNRLDALSMDDEEIFQMIAASEQPPFIATDRSKKDE